MNSCLDAVELFDLATRSTIEGRFADALALYEALAVNTDIEIRTEARFRKGQLLATLGRNREAAATYRRLLDEKPNAARVRVELAALLAALGDEPGARRELRQAQGSGLPDDVAAQVAQFSRALRSPQRAGASLDISIAPDTNINRATQLRTLDTVLAPLELSTDARAKSGIGLKLFGQGFGKVALANRLDIVFRANSLASLYRSSEFNDFSLSLLGGITWQLPRDRFTGAFNATRRWYGGQTYSDSRSVSFDWLRPLGERAQLTASASIGRVQYPSNDLQDGMLYDGSITVERALGARSGVAFGLSAARQDAADASYAYVAIGPTAYGWRELGQTTLFLATTSRRLIADTRNFLFLDKRREWLVTFRAGATLRQISIAGLSPFLRVGFERNRSTIAIYDYQKKFVEVGVTRSF
jgi:outer membrane protein